MLRGHIRLERPRQGAERHGGSPPFVVSLRASLQLPSFASSVLFRSSFLPSFLASVASIFFSAFFPSAIQMDLHFFPLSIWLDVFDPDLILVDPDAISFDARPLFLRVGHRHRSVFRSLDITGNKRVQTGVQSVLGRGRTLPVALKEFRSSPSEELVVFCKFKSSLRTTIF